MRDAGEFDLFVPLHYNDGSPVEEEKLAWLRGRLVERFGGVTDLRHRSEGQWRVGDVTFRDAIVLFRVLAFDDPAATKFLQGLKEEMKRTFRQEEVLIVERRVRVL